MSETRVYCDGALTKDLLAAKLDAGLVLIDVVRKGHSGGDVAYFRAGTAEEIANCQRTLGLAMHTDASRAADAVDPASGTRADSRSIPLSPDTATASTTAARHRDALREALEKSLHGWSLIQHIGQRNGTEDVAVATRLAEEYAATCRAALLRTGGAI